MALTLAEAAKLSNDLLLAGVIESIIKESPVLQALPFIEIVGDAWAESTPTFTQITTALTILGGDADVDNYLKATRSNVQDLEAAVVELKAKALRDKFEETSRTVWQYYVLSRQQLSYARPPLNAIPPPTLNHYPLNQHRKSLFPGLSNEVGPVHVPQEGKDLACTDIKSRGSSQCGEGGVKGLNLCFLLLTHLCVE